MVHMPRITLMDALAGQPDRKEDDSLHVFIPQHKFIECVEQELTTTYPRAMIRPQLAEQGRYVEIVLRGKEATKFEEQYQNERGGGLSL